jgi:hypothetical protein
MERNALHLLKSMRNQVVRDVSHDFEMARRWKIKIQNEVLGNDAWIARMGSIQLGVGGIIGIPGPTSSGLEFLVCVFLIPGYCEFVCGGFGSG